MSHNSPLSAMAALTSVFFLGREIGVVSNSRWSVYERQQADIETARRHLAKFIHSPQGWAALGFDVKHDGVMRR